MHEYRIYMVVGRLTLFVLGMMLAWYFAFKRTSELDGVENAWIYRVSYGMFIMRGFAYVMLDVFNLFPLE